MENKKSILEKLGLIEKIQPDKEVPSVQKSPDAVNKVKEEKKAKVVTLSPQKSIQTELNSFIDVPEIYKKYNFLPEGMNTVFIIDNYLKALPDYLPENLKRQSVADITNSSGMKIDALLRDGNERLKLLKHFLSEFSNETDKTIREYEQEIQVLSAKINKYKKSIDDRRKLQENQRAAIEYESQKINNIIDFMKSPE